jgi:acetylornithine deacetylase/succinyl-diaminopimelate desuccinylase-like protein
MTKQTRRAFVGGTLATGAALLVSGRSDASTAERAPIYKQIEQRHDEAVQRLQDWIRQPSIAAENRGMEPGCDMMMKMLRDVGFQHVERRPTDGQPGVFATYDAGAKRTVGLYFMYDVKQANPEEWSSPPWEARLVELPNVGRVVMGRAAVNQKGPQSALIAALRAFQTSGKKLPVNLVFVAEGEEEIGSPHFPQIVHATPVREAFAKCDGVFMPEAAQDLDGNVTISLGSKGVVELELIASGEKWGRGPQKDIHSSNRARVDSPAWRLVQALNSLIDANSEPAIDDFATAARRLTDAEEAMLDEASRRIDESTTLRALGVKQWARKASWRQALEDMASRPTVNIEGLVGGYTGPGGMTILPHRAVAKLDMRLVPDMTHKDAVAKLKAHLAKRGFGDIEVKVSGGYDPTTTRVDARIVRAGASVYRGVGIEPIFGPRRGGSWPGYVFTGDPLRLPAGHFGLGHGLRAHAPDEYYLIESKNPKLAGYNDAIKSYVDYLYALASI